MIFPFLLETCLHLDLETWHMIHFAFTNLYKQIHEKDGEMIELTIQYIHLDALLIGFISEKRTECSSTKLYTNMHYIFLHALKYFW